VDEAGAVWRAREMAAAVRPLSIPVDVHLYVDHLGGIVRLIDLPTEQPGYSTKIGDRLCIFVNQRDSSERRRFTICHEIAHEKLNLTSEHADSSGLNYSKRPWNEILCDVFAAELLLPYAEFKPAADDCEVGFAALDKLASQFEASVTSTGSRFAAASDLPCAFVLSQGNIIRYAARSKMLREAGAWIQLGAYVPAGSTAHAARVQGGQHTSEVPADTWFADWRRGGLLMEESRYLSKWDQCLTLLWFDDDEVSESEFNIEDDDEEPLLKELDGTLPWPDKRRRRR
jgi:Zn-dependent peptidase ImmA (M78 family)